MKTGCCCILLRLLTQVCWSQTPTVTPEMGDPGGRLFGRVPEAAKTRHYYIAAEPELWDYSPKSAANACGAVVPPYVETANRRATKLRYVEYSDATFTTKALPVSRLGILGPVLRGVVGEFIAVTFLNRTPQPLSMHPHGVRYDKDNEGSCQMGVRGLGSAIAPNARFTYVWQLDESSGPLPEEPSSKAWLYHSHVTGDGEAGAGLVGFIIVTDAKRARPDGTPADVDREMAALFMIFDESGLGQDAIEASEYAGKEGPSPNQKKWADIQQQLEAGARFAINGRTFNGLSGIEMNEGERVRWYLFGLGSEADFHTAHWHGLTVIEEGRRRTDVVELLPASMKLADMRADNPGQWLLHCHVSEHMLEGMSAACIVHPRTNSVASKEDAFFGLASASSSLRFSSVEALPGGILRLHGEVAVFEGFAIFKQPAVFELGGKHYTFQPDISGSVHTNEGSFSVVNANRFGVMQGSVMEFETRLHHAVPLMHQGGTTITLRLGDAAHTAKVVLSVGE